MAAFARSRFPFSGILSLHTVPNPRHSRKFLGLAFLTLDYKRLARLAALPFTLSQLTQSTKSRVPLEMRGLPTQLLTGC